MKDIDKIKNLGRPIDFNVVQNTERDWSALIQEKTGGINHERVHKKDLDESVQVDALRFMRWTPDQLLVQVREKTDGETMLMSNVKMPIKQFLALAWAFIESLPDVT